MIEAQPPADAIAAVTHPDPYPWYAALRAGPPLVFDTGLRLWVASRPEVVRAALRDPALRVRPPAEPVPAAIAGTPAGEVFGSHVRMNDGPLHAAIRPTLAAALSAIDPAQAHADALAVAEAGIETSDALGDPSAACLAFPVRAVAHLLGFTLAELPSLSASTADFVACLSPLSTPDKLTAAGAAAAALMARFEARVGEPTERDGSLLASVRRASPQGLSGPLLTNLVGLLSQTCEATAGLLGNSLVALARDPDRRRRIGTQWTQLPALVEEVARRDPSVHNTRRFVAAPTHLAAIALAPGDALLLVLASGEADPLGFGHGPHACPGRDLALILATAALQAMLSGGLDTADLQRRGWHYRPSVNLRIPVFH